VEILRIEIVEDIRNGPQFKGKKYFIVQILEDLANEHNFKLYKTYLSNIAGSFKYWAKVYVERHCQAEANDETRLMALAKVYLQTIIQNITEATHDLKKQFTINGNNDSGTEPYCESKEDSMDYFTNPDNDDEHCIEINTWLESFFKMCNKTLSVDSQEVQQMIGVEKLKNLNLFTTQFINNITKEKEIILQDFADPSTDISKITNWENPPHMVLYNTLIGCTEQCPFCKEQCELTDPDHLKLGKVHFAEIHRPQCLGGYVRVTSNRLELEICTEAIESDYATFKNKDTYNVHIPCKDYKKIYKDWLISNEKPRSGPIYWQWFCAEFNAQIVDWIGCTPTPVPSSWKRLTKDDAINSLSELYGSKVNK